MPVSFPPVRPAIRAMLPLLLPGRDPDIDPANTWISSQTPQSSRRIYPVLS